MNGSTPGLPVHHQLPEFTQTHAHWVGDVIQPSHLLSSPSPAPNPSQHQGLFQWVNLRMRWPKYWSFSFNISPSNEHPGLISFRMDWLDLLAVQGTLKSLLQLHSSKASMLLCSPYFIIQLSYPYMTPGKSIALARWIIVSKVISLLFNMLSRLVILKEISPNIHWKDWCWSWNSNTLATWFKQLTHLKSTWCWEWLKLGGEGDGRG